MSDDPADPDSPGSPSPASTPPDSIALENTPKRTKISGAMSVDRMLSHGSDEHLQRTQVDRDSGAYSLQTPVFLPTSHPRDSSTLDLHGTTRSYPTFFLETSVSTTGDSAANSRQPLGLIHSPTKSGFNHVTGNTVAPLRSAEGAESDDEESDGELRDGNDQRNPTADFDGAKCYGLDAVEAIRVLCQADFRRVES
ncbi:hypothetical protein CFRS1_v009608 [Colletotrichum fructicola]|nr:hypothetical protein CFRS1_v009608 [Colletotrichum fructicola]